jgi:hypothetical protein
MTLLRDHWYRILAFLVGPAAVLLSTAVALADDEWPG